MVETLKGQVLIAGPSLQDPNFQRTVLLVCEHSNEGALGLVYNRPSPVTVAEAMPTLRESSLAGSRLFLGGPVQTGSLFVVHDDFSAGGDDLGSGLFFGGEPEMLEILVGHMEADSTIAVRLFAGYSGWGEGQLEFEMSQGAWIVAPLDREQILGAHGLEAWRAALIGLGGRYAILAEAPLDPRMN